MLSEARLPTDRPRCARVPYRAYHLISDSLLAVSTLDTANVPFDGIPAFCSRKTVDSWLKVTKSASYKPVIAEAFLKPDPRNDLFHLDSPSKLLLDVPRPCVLMTLNWVAGLIETQPRCLLASKGAAVSSKRFSKILVQYANLTIRTTL